MRCLFRRSIRGCPRRNAGCVRRGRFRTHCTPTGAPAAGRSQRLPFDEVRQRLQAHGVNLAQLQFPGLQVTTARYAGAEHQAAIARLRERLAVPGFASALSPLERAELELLAAAPLDFVSCTARRAQSKA